jgi:hypothetical protein
MNKKTLGLIFIIAGVVIVSIISWVAPWWTSSVWSSAPPESFEGTAWAAFGPIFMLMSVGVPFGIILFTAGILIISAAGKTSLWLVVIVVVMGVLSMLYPPTTGYYPVAFGIGGGFILILFFMTVWIWVKNREKQNEKQKTAADLQFLSYVFFLLMAIQLCALLGNPFSGLYFPEKVIRDGSIHFHYSMGLKIIIYLILGFLFTFLSQYKKLKSVK